MRNIRFTDGNGVYAVVETSRIGKKRIFELFGPLQNGLLTEDVVPVASNTRTVMYVNAPNRGSATDVATSQLAATTDSDSVTRTANDTVELTVDGQKEENKNQYKVALDVYEAYEAEVATTAPTKEIAVSNIMKNPTCLEYALVSASVNLRYIRSCADDAKAFSESVLPDIEISDEEKVPDTYNSESEKSSETFSVNNVAQLGQGQSWIVRVSKTVSKMYDMVVDADNAIEAQNVAIEKIQGDYENGDISISYSACVDTCGTLKEIEEGENKEDDDVFKDQTQQGDQEEETEETEEDEDNLGSLGDAGEDLDSIMNEEDEDEEGEEESEGGVSVKENPFKA
jgi:hypothetical protein